MFSEFGERARFPVKVSLGGCDNPLEVELVERLSQNGVHQTGQHRLNRWPPFDVIVTRDEVDRCAHQRSADDLAPIDGAHEIGALKSIDARPETDERRPRNLRLQAGHALNHGHHLGLVPTK